MPEAGVRTLRGAAGHSGLRGSFCDRTQTRDLGIWFLSLLLCWPAAPPGVASSSQLLSIMNSDPRWPRGCGWESSEEVGHEENHKHIRKSLSSALTRTSQNVVVSGVPLSAAHPGLDDLKASSSSDSGCLCTLSSQPPPGSWNEKVRDSPLSPASSKGLLGGLP